MCSWLGKSLPWCTFMSSAHWRPIPSLTIKREIPQVYIPEWTCQLLSCTLIKLKIFQTLRPCSIIALWAGFSQTEISQLHRLFCPVFPPQPLQSFGIKIQSCVSVLYNPIGIGYKLACLHPQVLTCYSVVFSILGCPSWTWGNSYHFLCSVPSLPHVLPDKRETGGLIKTLLAQKLSHD